MYSFSQLLDQKIVFSIVRIYLNPAIINGHIDKPNEQIIPTSSFSYGRLYFTKMEVFVSLQTLCSTPPPVLVTHPGGQQEGKSFRLLKNFHFLSV